MIEREILSKVSKNMALSRQICQPNGLFSLLKYMLGFPVDAKMCKMCFEEFISWKKKFSALLTGSVHFDDF